MIWDHPRVCGEHREHGSRWQQSGGSSPRMRGTPAQRRGRTGARRIIPAYAGNTRGRILFDLSGGDHPRVCGEHSVPLGDWPSDWGSSPRMRGTLAVSVSTVLVFGIIPAYAGNTIPLRLLLLMFWDHPRVCGEHISVSGFAPAVMGSSPRMRGTRYAHDRPDSHSRIIPAYAGNTSASRNTRARGEDHPRVCGEHPMSSRYFAKYGGSSPRMRGTPSELESGWQYYGIIPAYAGNTRSLR